MMLGRLAAALLFLTGLLVGTLAEPALPHAPRRGGGYLILAADFHVHGFPGDGALAPWALRNEARRAGLDVFALSNHNRVSTARLARWLAPADGWPLVVVAQEVTSGEFHMIAAGIEEAVDWTRGPANAIREVHAQGGVAIAAHPERKYWPAWDDEAVRLLDGYERAHASIWNSKSAADYQAFGRRVVALNPEIAPIGSSDFHFTGRPGVCRTYVLARQSTAGAVIEAVRAGRTVAADSQGRLYGRPEWVRVVEAAGGHVPTAPASAAVRLAVAMAWLGAVGMLLLGGGRR